MKLIALDAAVTCDDVWGDVVTYDLAPAICRSAVECVVLVVNQETRNCLLFPFQSGCRYF